MIHHASVLHSTDRKFWQIDILICNVLCLIKNFAKKNTSIIEIGIRQNINKNHVSITNKIPLDHIGTVRLTVNFKFRAPIHQIYDFYRLLNKKARKRFRIIYT